jgi:hypothetical protein
MQVRVVPAPAGRLVLSGIMGFLTTTLLHQEISKGILLPSDKFINKKGGSH